MQSPEFRAASMLFFCGFLGLALLLVSALGGAFAACCAPAHQRRRLKRPRTAVRGPSCAPRNLLLSSPSAAGASAPHFMSETTATPTPGGALKQPEAARKRPAHVGLRDRAHPRPPRP